MQAFISGQAGTAIIVRGTDASIINIDSPDVELKCSYHSIPYILEGVSDVEQFSDIKKTDILARLKSSWQNDRALFFFLTFLSNSESATTYELALDSLTDLIKEKSVKEFILNRMYTAPLPDDNRIGELLSSTIYSESLNKVLKEIFNYQDTISLIKASWDNVPTSLFNNDTNKKSAFFNALEKYGIQRKLAISSNDHNAFYKAEFDYYTIFKTYDEHIAIIRNWTKSFRPQKIDSSSREAIESVELDIKNQQKSKSRKREKPVHEIFTSVQRQIAAIVKLIQSNDLDKAQLYTNQLITQQVNGNGKEFAAKSLCKLANEARNIANYSLQLEWTQRAVKLFPSDGKAQGQLAESYYRLAQYDNAQKHFELASINENKAYGICGYARILKKLGNLDKALSVYSEALEKFPNDIHIIIGKARTLANMHKFDEALQEYERVIGLYPADSTGYISKATTLRYMGKLDKSIEIYNYALKEFEPDLEAYCGKAWAQKELGQFNSSIETYEIAKSKFPNDPKPLSGLAEVWKDAGDIEKMFSTYNEAKSKFHYDLFSNIGYAKSLHLLGKIEEAEQEYDLICQNFANSYFARDAKALFLQSQKRYDEALNAYDKNKKDFPYDISSWIGRAKILKLFGQLDDAIDSYNHILSIRENDQQICLSKASLLIASNRFDEAKQLLSNISIPEHPKTKAEWVGHHIKGMIKLKSAKTNAEFNNVINFFEEALHTAPSLEQKKFFKAGLALAQIKFKRFGSALSNLALDDGQPLITLLRMHACAEKGYTEEAKQCYKYMKNFSLPKNSTFIILSNEIAAKYKLANNLLQHHNDNWIIETEEKQVFLMVA
jgi:tetratricopeptide (TPR) repeat protein